MKRTGFLGVEQDLDGGPYNQPTDLTKGREITVDTGFDIGLSGAIPKTIFDGAVDYTCEIYSKLNMKANC